MNETTFGLTFQTLNPFAWHRPLLRINRVIPQVLRGDDGNFLDERVSIAVCVRESTTDEPRERFIDKTHDVNTKAGHSGDFTPWVDDKSPYHSLRRFWARIKRVIGRVQLWDLRSRLPLQSIRVTGW